MTDNLLKKNMQNYKVVRVAFSSGKDSSCVMHLVLKSAIELKSEGLFVPKILVTTSDTGIENPVVTAQVNSDHEKINLFAQEHELDITTKVVRPSLSSSFYGRTLATGVIPAYGNMNRSCTGLWKVAPQKAFATKFLKAECLKKADMLTLVGSRSGESISRKSRMNKQGIQDGHISLNDENYPVMAPIHDWSTDDVFMFLSEINNNIIPKTYSDMSDVLKVYKDANGECPIINDNLSKNAKACGARFGCFLCVAGTVASDTPGSINGDKSLEKMISHEENGVRPYEYLKPLANIQRFLASIQYDFSRRTFIGRNEEIINNESYLKIEPGIFNGATVTELLEYILTAQADENSYAKSMGIKPRFELITVDEIVYLDAKQSMVGLTRTHAAIDAYYRINDLGERFYPEHYTKTFVARTSKPQTRYIKLEHKFDIEFACFEADCLSEDIEMEYETLDSDEFYSVGQGVAAWIKNGGAKILSERFQNNAANVSRLDSFYFWNNNGVRVSKRAINNADNRIILTESIEAQGLYEMTEKEIYSSALSFAVKKKVRTPKKKKKSLSEIPVAVKTPSESQKQAVLFSA